MSTTLSSINNERIKARKGETYTSEALNVHNSAMPAGVLYGFTISVPSARNIRFSTDSTLGVSLARIRVSNVVLTYRETSSVTLDLASYGGTTIYIGITCTYSTGATTTGSYVAYSASEYAAGVAGTIWLCSVAVPGSGSLALSDVDTSCRSRAWREVYVAPDLYPWAPCVSDPLLSSAAVVGGQVVATGNATSEVTNATVSQGIQSFHFYLSGGSSAGNCYRMLRELGVASPQSKVRVRFRLKTSGATATEAGIYLRWRTRSLSFISSELVGVALSASTADWTTYDLEVTVPATAYFFDIGAGVTSLSAGALWIEAIQVFSEKASPTERGNAAPGLLTSQLRLLGESITNVNQMYFAFSDEDELMISTDRASVLHIGDATGATIDLEVHGALTAGDVTATTYSYSADRTRYVVIDFSEYQTGRWLTANEMQKDNDLNWPTLLATPGSSEGALALSLAPYLKKGETLSGIVIGVDDATDTTPPQWDIAIYEYHLTTGNPSLQDSTAALSRSGSANIREVSWGSVSYTKTNAALPVLFVEQTAGTAHHHYYIKLEISTPGVDESLGLE